MGGSCPEDQYWNALVKHCMHCNVVCQDPHVITKCSRYCMSLRCKSMPGHVYDGLLKKCVTCAKVCGQHPAECFQHCQTPSPPVTTGSPFKVTIQNSRPLSAPTALEDPTVLLYSLLALCMLLLLSSMSLALAVFLKGGRGRTSKPKTSNHTQKIMVKQGLDYPPQPGQSAKDFTTQSHRPADRMPSDDSIPTETCVCVHCFPDLTTLGHCNDRALTSYYQQAVVQHAQTQNRGPFQTEESIQTSGVVQGDAAVG